MQNFKRNLFLPGACLLTAGLVFSTNLSAEVRTNGFANIVFGSTFDKDESTYGYDDTIDFKNESLFALQFTGDLGDGLSATAQVVARGADDFNTEFSWAYMSYDLSDQSNIKVGRLRLPFYTYSEFLEVGYAYHWIRTPQTVYAFSFNNADGISYSYNTALGDWDSSVQLLYGRYLGPSDPGGIESPSDLRGVSSFVWSLTDNEWTFRLAYSQCTECEVDVPFDQVFGFDLIGTLESVGAGHVGRQLTFDEDKGFFANVGIKYDGGSWFIESEAVRLGVENTFLADNQAWYVSSGIRSGDFVWHATVEHHKNEAKTDIPISDVPAIQIAPPSPVTLQDVVAGLVNSQEGETQRYTIGMRYNFHPSAAFKLEYHTISDKLDSANDRSLITGAISLVF
jgi:hypothetical protein